mmetsp:Transcript_71050/g.153125  ORF Transcript_71050/g.153125 Transcript_71050/m.153125 type:complete len:216 (+) Transcript_71050:411-1058(+)
MRGWASMSRENPSGMATARFFFASLFAASFFWCTTNAAQPRPPQQATAPPIQRAVQGLPPEAGSSDCARSFEEAVTAPVLGRPGMPATFCATSPIMAASPSRRLCWALSMSPLGAESVTSARMEPGKSPTATLHDVFPRLFTTESVTNPLNSAVRFFTKSCAKSTFSTTTLKVRLASSARSAAAVVVGCRSFSTCTWPPDSMSHSKSSPRTPAAT